VPNDEVIQRAQSGPVTIRQDLVEEVTIGNDATIAAGAANAKAEIEARIIAARRWRRDVDVFREGLLKDCRRPLFAEKALYHKPVGRKKNPETGEWEEAFATNFSIRFIEDALQHFTNWYVISRVIADDARQTKIFVAVLDVERNTGYGTEQVIEKVIERKEAKKGRKVVGQRENSYGDMVLLLEATKDEMRNLIGAERSKLIRDQGQRLLPSDVLEEARMLIDRTVVDETAKDPDAAKKKVLDRFAGLGISASMLKEYLGKPLETLTTKDLADLAPIHNGLKEGDFTWPDLMRMKEEPAEGEAPAPGAPPATAGKRPPLRDRVMQQPSFLPPEKPEKPKE